MTEIEDLIERHYSALTPTGAEAVRAFHRFLKLGLSPYDGGALIRRFYPGWLPYLWGVGPEPPPYFDTIPVTGWTVPS